MSTLFQLFSHSFFALIILAIIYDYDNMQIQHLQMIGHLIDECS